MLIRKPKVDDMKYWPKNVRGDRMFDKKLFDLDIEIWISNNKN